MPNTANAKKALRQNKKHRLLNRSGRASLRTVLKKFRIAAEGDDPEQTQAAYRLAVKRLDQAAAKNLIHKNKASRTKSRLSKLIAKPDASAQ
jgi:small subunit ribosomal protein S20